MTLNDLRHNHTHLLLRCISGSQAYGLALPHSDTDIKGVYVLPRTAFYSLTYIDQVNNDSNDEMYYELRKFIDLLLKNNPNLLELLNTPEDCVQYRHPLINRIKPEMFLSRLCNQTFGQYAYAQVKKARGLNKKILNPLDLKRKTILDFCYILQGQGSVSAQAWLDHCGYQQEACGLTRVDHMRDVYVVFHESQANVTFNGICSGTTSDEVSLSSIPKGLDPVATLYFNKDGYSVYCKEYRQYWEWVNQRNEDRYENTISHGKNYDAKNMMHVFRLLNMAEEIALYKHVNVRRPERDWLLRIRAGEFAYDDLVKQAEEKIERIHDLFKQADLPDTPDAELANDLLYTMRRDFYDSW
jgi:hypothetical protein